VSRFPFKYMLLVVVSALLALFPAARGHAEDWCAVEGLVFIEGEEAPAGVSVSVTGQVNMVTKETVTQFSGPPYMTNSYYVVSFTDAECDDGEALEIVAEYENMYGINSTATLDINDLVFASVDVNLPKGNIVEIGGQTKAPATVTPGDTGVVLEQLTLKVASGSVTITGVRVDEDGTSNDFNVEKISVVDDLDTDGTWDGGEPELGSGDFSSGIANIALDSSYVISDSATRSWLLAYNLASAATVSETLQARLADTSYITLSSGTIYSEAFPLSSSAATIVCSSQSHCPVNGEMCNFGTGACEVDPTSPTDIAWVYDGTGADIAYTYATGQLSANWADSSDPESSIEHYWYAIGTATGGTDVLTWTDNATSTSVTATGLSLTPGEEYYFSVLPENGAGDTGKTVYSNGQTAGVFAAQSAVQVDNLAIDVEFNQAVDSSASAVNTANYSLDGGMGNPDSAVVQGDKVTVRLTFSTMDMCSAYQLSISGVEDNNSASFYSGSSPVDVETTNTLVSADITEDTTWSASGSPYCLTTDVTVATDTTLIVESGATVYVKPSVDSADEGWADVADLLVFGQLDIQGASGSSVVFTSSATSPAAGDWGGIRLYPGGDLKTISYLDLSYSARGLYIDQTYATVDNSTFSNCATAGSCVETIDSYLFLSDNSFSSCSGAGYYCVSAYGTAQTPFITRNGFSSSGNGVYVDATAYVYTNDFNGLTDKALELGSNYSFVFLLENNFRNSATGVYLEADSKSVQAGHCYLSGNTLDTDTNCSGCSISTPYQLGDRIDRKLDISKTVFKQDGTYTTDLGEVVSATATLYIQVEGADYDSSTANSMIVQLTSETTDPDGIFVELVETGVNTGIYRGTAQLDSSTDQSTETLGVGSGEIVTVTQGRDDTKYDTVYAGEDPTPPADISFVYDGATDFVDIDWVGNVTSLSASWATSSDSGSGLAKYWYSIGSASGSSDVVGWTDNGLATSVTHTGLTLTDAVTYYFNVKAEDNSGLQSSVASSDGQTVDKSPPAGISAVYDCQVIGCSSDNDWVGTSETLYVSWATTTDTGSGLAAYWYAIGTATGATDVVDWTDVGLSSSAADYQLSLSEGTTYYTSVKAVDEMDNFTAEVYSDGQTVDTTTPERATNVKDGLGDDIDWASSATTVSANWTAGVDNESGMQSYLYSIGTDFNDVSILDWTESGTDATYFTHTGLSIPENTRYYVKILAKNNAGGYDHTVSALNTSDGFIVDTSAPVPPSYVYDGSAADLDYATTTSQLSVNWGEATDSLSGIAAYLFGIGTTEGATDVLGWRQTTQAATTVTGLALTEGQSYYFTVKARNGAMSDCSAVNSDGAMYDITAPASVAPVNDGTGTDIDWSTATGELSANWSGSSDTHAGLSHYEYAIGTTAGATDVLSWTVTSATSATVTGLSLTDGQEYYFSVSAVDNAGLKSVPDTSDGISVDNSPPLDVESVIDGPGASDIDYTSDNSRLDASWSDTSDPGSGLSHYEYAIGTTAGATDVFSWATTSATSAAVTGLSLADGQAYYFTVKAENNVGLDSTPADSDGVVVDTSTPSAVLAVYDGLYEDAYYNNTGDRIKANWEAASDTQSGIARYWYSVGTAPGASDTVPWTDNSTYDYVSKSGLSLVEDETYYVSVIAENGAGLLSTAASSDGQLVDTIKPAQSGWSPASGSTVLTASPTITLTTDESATCSWSLSDQAFSEMTDECSGAGTTNHSCASSGLDQGDEVVYISCSDPAGNENLPADNAELEYFVDSILPSQSSWDPAKGASFASTSTTLAFQTDENATCRWSLSDQDYSVIPASRTCSGAGTTSQSCAVTGMAEGAEYVYLSCRDDPGNMDTSATNENIDYTVDLSPPVQSSWDPSGGSTVATETPSIDFSLDENGSCRWSLSDLGFSDISSDNDCSGGETDSQSCSVTGLSEGAETVYLACSDTLGNADTSGTNTRLDYTVDLSPPEPSGWNPTDGSTITNNSPSIGFTTDESGYCRWSLTDLGYGDISSDNDCGGGGATTHSCSTSGLAEGSAYVYISCSDTHGNSDTAATNAVLNYNVDTSPPVQSGWSPATGTVITASTASVQFTTGEIGYCRWSLADLGYAAISSDNDCGGSGTTIHSCPVSGMADGELYVYTACTDDLGNADSSTTNTALSYTVDTTPPAPGGIDPAPGSYIPATSYDISLTTDEEGTCRWSLADLGYSAISSDNDCTGGGTTSHSCPVSGMADGAEDIYISCTDLYGNNDSASSNEDLSYTVDSTAPDTISNVYDGATFGVDISETDSATQLSATWSESSDAGSGIVGYWYSIGTSAGASDTVQWTSAGTATSVTKTGLALMFQETYYFSVKAENGAGLMSTPANSDGQLVNFEDTTPPAPPSWVYDGASTGLDTDYAGSASQLGANWSDATDGDSGIAGYWYSIGTTQGASDTLSWSGAGAVNSVTATGLSLSEGAKYYFSVVARNGTGLFSTAVNSDGQTVDASPPEDISYVYDGGGADIDFSTSSTDLAANWAATTDSISIVIRYWYALGTAPGATDTIDWTDNETNTSVSLSSLSLAEGDTYYFSVKAEDIAGNMTDPVSSDGVKVDATAPDQVAWINDGSGDDEDVTSLTAQIAANWAASSDTGSGIDRYWYSLGTSSGASNTVSWTDNGTDTSVSLTGMNLSDGQTYYFTVVAQNGVGLLSTPKSSDGILVSVTDVTAPADVSAVNDGAGADADYTTSASSLSANWEDSTDPETGISAYWYSAGTSSGASDTVSWTSTGAATSVTHTGLSLANGQAYYFSVVAVNGVGLKSGPVSSDGITVDTTAPAAPSAVNDGTGADLSYSTSTSQLSANWSGTTDAESGISAYWYSIGTSTGASDTVSWTSTGAATSVTSAGLTLTGGQTYYVTVAAVNGAGLKSGNASSDGVTIDSTAPAAVATVNDGIGDDIDTAESSSELSANWTAATDGESGIARYWYSIGTSSGASDTVAWTGNGTDLSVTRTGLSLAGGQTYYFSVKAENGAGIMSAPAVSDGQAVQTLDPLLTIYEGWNQVGVSKQGASISPGSIFSGVDEYYIIDGVRLKFITDKDPVELEQFARGYWIYSSGDAGSFNPEGTVQSGSYPLNFATSGWKMISNPFTANLDWSDTVHATLECGSPQQQVSLPPIYHFEPELGYSAVQPGSGQMVPWKGYWIKLEEDNCKLTFTE